MGVRKIVFLLTLFLLGKGFTYKIKAQANGLWSGTVTEYSSVTGQPGIQAESKVTINYNNNVGTGTYTKNDVLTIDGKVYGRTNCRGLDTVGFAELSIDNAEKTYTIQTSALIYTCTYLDGSSDSGEAYITIAYEPWDENPRVLRGSKTIVSDVAGGKLTTTTTTWDLVKGSEVDLIITPQEYDRWLPIPGSDEQTPGPKMMNVTLELKDRNGRPASEKTKVFKLQLSNTSKEKGITINMPLDPATQQLPDLRFQPQQGAVVTQEGQSMIITCPAGCLTVNFSIACYDGGAWTTLTAVAVLETDSIKGTLLEPSGEKDIRIPKRKVGSKIATTWLDQNGNPGEADDDETSAGNTNNGDGLSAYEEYRGVISNGSHKRLDPKMKELGVLMKSGEAALFRTGREWFEASTQVLIVRFKEGEIGADRRLNKNYHTAHIYDQYALRLVKGHVRKNVMGRAEGGPGIPEKVTRVIIDVNQIDAFVRKLLADAAAANVQIPFTFEEMLAKVVAHELGHGVDISHHGNHNISKVNKLVKATDPFRIYRSRASAEITDRDYRLEGTYGIEGNQQSGDIFCIMCYTPCFDYSAKEANGIFKFYIVPFTGFSNTMCTDPAGTDYNDTPYYFGAATNGNCLSRIKLK